MTLGLDPDELAGCVACGLCLPHCPTYRVSGEEALSPRGRIAAMRAIEAGADPSAAFMHSIDTCVQCRGCETACPSGVTFGHLMEGTRAAIHASIRPVPRWQRAAYRVLRAHRLLLALSTVAALAQRLHLLPGRLRRRLGLPAHLPLRRGRLVPTGDDVWLFTGCVMDAWQRHVHAAAIAVLTATGAGVAVPPSSPCCGALHVHAGLEDEGLAMARQVMTAFPGDAPILVDSAGCGAALKGYGDLVGTLEAVAFARRVLDVHEWLADHASSLPAVRIPQGRVALHDPCHLRHAQRTHAAVRTVLAPYAETVELDDEGLCCGAGGAFAVVQPALAGAIRDRKVDAVARTGAVVVASANPGCALHLSEAGLDVRHPVELMAAAIEDGGRGR
jgi:glycolate oxidase iron-sulfur subunit